MDEQGYRFGVGVLVVASLVIVIILILFFGAAPNLFAKRYQVTINFPEAPGVETDTPVRKNGVQIGRVTSVTLLDVDEKGRDRGVNLTLELDMKHKLRASEVARIGTGSIITGDAVVEFIRGSEQSRLDRFDGVGGSPKDRVLDANELKIADTFLANGDYSGDGAGQVAPDPLKALTSMQDSFAPTLAAIQQASNQVNGLAADIRQVIGTGNGPLQQIGARTEETITNFNQTLDAIEGLFNDQALKGTIVDVKEVVAIVSERLPVLINEIEDVVKTTKTTITSFEGAGKAAEKTMNNVAEFTEPLGKNGERIVNDALRTLNNLDALLTDVRKISAMVNNGQGTFKKLLEDEQLYYSFVRTLENVEQVSRRIQPIVEDVRIMSDKLARDPSQLINLRGAISGRGPGLGVK